MGRFCTIRHRVDLVRLYGPATKTVITADELEAVRFLLQRDHADLCQRAGKRMMLYFWLSGGRNPLNSFRTVVIV